MNGKDYTSNVSSGTSLEFTEYLGADLNKTRILKPRIPSDLPYHKGNHTPRTEMVGRSYFSIRNQSREMNKIDKTKLFCVEKLLTFTYGSIPSSHFIVKRHLERLSKWIKYHYPLANGFWVIENQEQRSMRDDEPDICFHIHMLLYNLDWIPKPKLRSYWDKTTGSDIEQVVEIEAVKNAGDINNYLNKYLSKGFRYKDHNKAFLSSKVGRSWGRINRKELSKLITPRKTIITIRSDVTASAPNTFINVNEPVLPLDGDDALYQDIQTTSQSNLHDDEVIFVPTKNIVDGIHQKYKKIVMDYIANDMQSRGKKYNRRNNYDRHREENGFCKKTGEIFYKTTFLKLRNHTLYSYMKNKTHQRLLHFILDSYKEPDPDNIHTKINQRAKAYDRVDSNI